MYTHLQTTLPSSSSKLSLQQPHLQSTLPTNAARYPRLASTAASVAFVPPYAHNRSAAAINDPCSGTLVVNSSDVIVAQSIPLSHPHVHPHSQPFSHAHMHSHGRPRCLPSTQLSSYHFTHTVPVEPSTTSTQSRPVVPSLPLSHLRAIHPILASARSCNGMVYEHPLLPGIYPLSPLACALRRQPSPFIGSLTRDEFIRICTLYLDNGIRVNEQDTTSPDSNHPLHSQPESVFFSVTKPDFSTEEYVRRLVHYAHCSPAAFVVMLIYLDRIAHRNQRLRITSFNLHRLLITSLMLACKFLDDQCFSTMHYAKAGGIPTVKEMNRLEIHFLSFLDYRLCVPTETFYSKQHNLDTYIRVPTP